MFVSFELFLVYLCLFVLKYDVESVSSRNIFFKGIFIVINLSLKVGTRLIDE